MMTATPARALVQPFRGERYAHNRLRGLIAPPYDVISPAERAALVLGDPHNIVELILPEGGGGRYENAATLLDKWRGLGEMRQDREPAAYVLQQEFRGPDGAVRRRTGVIGAVAVEPYDTGRVKPHERTHAEPKADRLALLRALQATYECLFLLARDDGGELRRELERRVRTPPVTSAGLNDVRVRLWRVDGDDATRLARAAGETLYIADGHHRYETAVAYQSTNPAADRTVALIVPLGDPGLVVLPTHRLIYGAPLDSADLRDRLAAHFEIAEHPPGVDATRLLAGLKRRGTACVAVFPDVAYALVLRDGVDLAGLDVADHPAVRSLDVARVDALAVRPLLGAAGTAARVGYTPDAAAVAAEVGSARGAVAGVLLNPTGVEEVLAVADAGAAMPQKSTYFVPKVPSGVVGLRYDA